MFWPFGRWRRWPGHLPRLYPRLDSRALSRFLTEEEYARLRAVPRVRVLPLFSEEGTAEEAALGTGLARVLQRNLLLLPGLSVRTAEDTPLACHEEVQRYPSLLVEEWLVTGRVRLRRGELRAELELWSHTGQGVVKVVKARGLDAWLTAATEAVAEALGAKPSEEVRRRWLTGRPARLGTLLRFGDMCLTRGLLVEDVLALREKDAGFVLPVHLLEDDTPDYAKHLLRALEVDPYDAQLHFLLFCATWTDKGEQPEAMQFIRRALELAPGHGKAHMCAPHAAARRVDMRWHAELGYRLLPGNSFAISNYINALLDGEAPRVERVLELSREIIEMDPQSPHGYMQAIHVLRRAGRAGEALTFAEELRRLYGPPMDARTRYCLEQNPEVRDGLRAGKVDPAKELGELMEALRREAARRG